MLTVLWVMSMAGVLTTAALTTGETAGGAARNRTEWERARWRAAGCARRAQRAIDSIVGAGQRGASANWRSLDVALVSAALPDDCVVTLEAAGTTLDVNSATPEMLERLFDAMGRVDGREIALQIAAARDSAAVADIRELDVLLPHVDWTDYDSLLGVEPGRVAISRAPQPALRAIPGFDEEIAAAVVAARESRGPLADLTDVLALVSRHSARELEERFQDAARAATADPDAWILRSTASNGNPPIRAMLEWRIIREGDHAAIVRSTLR
jgi:hypothetical protein